MTEPDRCGDDLGELPSHLPADAPFTEADLIALRAALDIEED